MNDSIINDFFAGIVIDTYNVYGHKFCLKFFAKLTNLSEYIVKSVLCDYWMGQRLYSHGNNGRIKQLRQGTLNFICWMKEYSEAYGQYAPDKNTTVLSYWQNKTFLYHVYLDETPEPHISKSSFFQNFKTYFSAYRVDKSLPHIIISKYSSHSICTQCVALNNMRRRARNETELKLANDLMNLHKTVFGCARRAIQKLKQLALLYPEDHLFIQIDGRTSISF